MTIIRSPVVGYAGAHLRVLKDRGPARAHLCRECGKQAEEWAYDGGDEGALVDPRGREFSLSPEHYDPLCAGCHRQKDQGGQCRKGHPWTPESLYEVRGKRYCRTCRTEYMRRYRSRQKENASG